MANALALKSPGIFTGTPVFLGDLMHIDPAFAKVTEGIVTIEDLQSDIDWSPVDEAHSPVLAMDAGDPYLEFNGGEPHGLKRLAWNVLRNRDGISGYAVIRVSSTQPTSVATLLELVDGVSLNTNSNRAWRIRLSGTLMQQQLDFGPSASVVTASAPAIFNKFMLLDWGFSVAANQAYIAVNGSETVASLGGQGPFSSAGDKPVTLFYRDDASTETHPQSMTGGLKLMSGFSAYHPPALRAKYRSQLMDRFAL